MNKFREIFKLTYTNKVTSKIFIITTLLLISIIILAFNIDKVKKIFVSTTSIAVMSTNDDLSKQLKDIGNVLDSNIIFEKVKKENVNNILEKEEFDYVLDASLDNNNELTFNLIGRDQATKNILDKVKKVTDNLQLHLNVMTLNLNNKDITVLQKESSLKSTSIKKEENFKLSSKESDFQLVFSYVIIVIMFFIIMMYSSQMFMEIALEKNSRVIEVIITSVKPKIYIAAKIVSIVSVALTQLLILSLSAFCCNYFFGSYNAFSEVGLEATNKSTSFVLLCLVYWIIGILSYIILSSLFGTFVSKMEDSGQVLMPVIVLLMGSFYIAIFSMDSSNNFYLKISSYLPLISPFAMLVRLGNNSVDTNQLIISILINISFIYMLFKLVVKSFKNSVLSKEKKMRNYFKKIFR